jgi:2-dehydro-3-deoxyglucarate aldolase/4-hydroxy-2-oxoheptanedioate aldolase
MKPNRFKQVLTEGKVPVGHMVLEFGTRGMPKILEAAGLDFVVVDMEHTGFTSAHVADMIAWFKATPIAPFVRIPQTQYHFVARTLDVGALGIMVPNVRSAAEARAIVDAAKYTPLGNRGLIIGAANTDFRSANHQEFMDYSNENTTIICQIESQEGLSELEAIATTPGIDVLWVGQGDLAKSLGIPAQFQHPQFRDALKLVVDTTRRHGLAAGIQPGSLAQAQEWIEIGFNVISYGGDMRVYLKALTEGVAEVRRIAGER